MVNNKLSIDCRCLGVSYLRTISILPASVVLFIAFCIPQLYANPLLNKELTVLDRQTGLMWQKGDSFHDLKKGLNWYDALEYVGGKNSEKYAGYNDWRLPTMNELNALWDSSRSIKSKDGELIGLSAEFAGGGSYYLWSGDERGLDNVWYFGLGQKENYFNLKDLADLDQGVKMVRNP